MGELDRPQSLSKLPPKTSVRSPARSGGSPAGQFRFARFTEDPGVVQFRRARAASTAISGRTGNIGNCVASWLYGDRRPNPDSEGAASSPRPLEWRDPGSSTATLFARPSRVNSKAYSAHHFCKNCRSDLSVASLLRPSTYRKAGASQAPGALGKTLGTEIAHCPSHTNKEGLRFGECFAKPARHRKHFDCR